MHVLSEAAQIGGITRLVERWVVRDSQAISSIIVTRQQAVVDTLVRAANSTGGDAIALGGDGPASIERAGRLRELAREADFVICHLHSDDVVVAAAFGAGYRGAPVAIYNHADHLFWVAPTNATAVIDARAAGCDLTRRGRGYRPVTSLTLPLPVPRSSSAEIAIPADLGAVDAEVVVISVARPIKFQDTLLRPHFSDIVSAALDGNPLITYVAVGPTASDVPWPRLAERFGERIVLTGPVRDPRPTRPRPTSTSTRFRSRPRRHS